MFVACLRYMHTDIVSGGHLKSDLAGFVGACVVEMTTLHLPTAEAGKGCINAAFCNLQEMGA